MNERVRAHLRERVPVGHESRLLEKAASLEVVRRGLIAPEEAAYYLGWRERVNPDGKPLQLLYSHMGPDIVTPMLAADPSRIVAVDFLHWNADEIAGVNRLEWRKRKMPESALQARREKGFYYSPGNEQRALLLCNELSTLGVAPETVLAERVERGVDVHFQYDGRARQISFIEATWDRFVRERLAQDDVYDVFFEKAQLDTNSFLRPNETPYLSSHIRPGGFVMSAMGNVNARYDAVSDRRIRSKRFAVHADKYCYNPVPAPFACNRLIQRMRMREEAHIMYGIYIQVAQKEPLLRDSFPQPW